MLAAQDVAARCKDAGTLNQKTCFFFGQHGRYLNDGLPTNIFFLLATRSIPIFGPNIWHNLWMVRNVGGALEAKTIKEQHECIINPSRSLESVPSISSCVPLVAPRHEHQAGKCVIHSTMAGVCLAKIEDTWDTPD
jgi:hypothetical protein